MSWKCDWWEKNCLFVKCLFSSCMPERDFFFFFCLICNISVENWAKVCRGLSLYPQKLFIDNHIEVEVVLKTSNILSMIIFPHYDHTHFILCFSWNVNENIVFLFMLETSGCSDHIHCCNHVSLFIVSFICATHELLGSKIIQ